MNENKNTTCQSLWDEVKAVLRRKFTSINVYNKKTLREPGWLKSVKRPTSAQVMFSGFVSSRPAAVSTDPLQILSPCLSAPPLLML